MLKKLAAALAKSAAKGAGKLALGSVRVMAGRPWSAKKKKKKKK